MSFPTGISPQTTLHADPFDSYGDAIPAGMPAFVPATMALPQYSSLGRMEPEFLGNEVNPEGADEDERPIIARGRTTRILGFAPREGWTGTRVIVRLLFRRGRIASNPKDRLRVKMGNIPLVTLIGGIEPVNGVGGEWLLEIIAPDAVELDVVGLKVPLIVQVLNNDTKHIVDDVCIGTFQFKSSPPISKPVFNILDNMDLERIEDDTEDASLSARPGYPKPISAEQREMPYRSGEIPLRPMADSADTPRNPQAQTAARSARKRARLSINVPRDIAQNLLDNEASPEALSPTVVRNPPVSQKPGEHIYPATLTLHGDLDSMTQNWTNEEVENNRRVVEFVSVQKQGNINISFAPVGADDVLDASRNVVSCIWWDDVGAFVITSVDTINLLERLVDTKFSTEEKNRIRRNLQGFKPATVSKTHPQSKEFFQMLMEFPVPRPRNIEKDVKAFCWSKLGDMLEKVMSKYWFVITLPGSDSEDQGSSPRVRVVRDPDSTSADSPDAVGLPLSTSQTPASTQQSQSQSGTRTPRTGTIPTYGYFMATPSTPDQQSPHHPYVDSLESSAYVEGPGVEPHDSSMYGTVDSLMEIGESSMQDLHTLQMSASHHPGLYHEQLESYPDGLGISSGNVYEHDIVVGADVLVQGTPVDVPFTAHTSHGYA